MLDLLKLKTFQVVAARNSFTRAAAELGYSQSSVTTHIQALEHELGASLFDRVSRNVVLTDAGRRTLEYANQLMALADEAKAAIHRQGELSGPISVTAPDSLVVYRLPEVLRQFQVLYPHVQLTLGSDSDCDAQIDAVLEGTVDLAFVVNRQPHSDQLMSTSLRTEDMLIVGAPDYRFVSDEGFSFENLPEERVLLSNRNCPFRQLFEQFLSTTKMSLHNLLTLSSIEAVKHCAMAGMGLAVVPEMAVTAELKARKLVSLLWPGVGSPVHIQMVRHRQRSASPALHALWSLSEQRFGEHGNT